MPHSAPLTRLVAQQAKTKNIIDMALTFSATLRVFSSQSKARISARLEGLFVKLGHGAEPRDYESMHAEFCEWFTATIRTAEKEGKHPKRSGPSSYGHGAKILDVSAKVYVYYCSLPSPEVAAEVTPMLHCPADTAVMKHLAALPMAQIASKTIAEIDRDEYRKLQALVLHDIRENHADILPVE